MNQNKIVALKAELSKRTTDNYCIDTACVCGHGFDRKNISLPKIMDKYLKPEETDLVLSVAQANHSRITGFGSAIVFDRRFIECMRVSEIFLAISIVYNIDKYYEQLKKLASVRSNQ